MKAILTMILSFCFIGNAVAACPQDMGYLAPVDILPVCKSGSVHETEDSQVPTGQKVEANAADSTRYQARMASADTYVLCPQDIGYLAPADMLPPCSASDLARISERTTGSNARVGVKTSIVRQASAGQLRLAIMKRNPKLQVVREDARHP